MKKLIMGMILVLLSLVWFPVLAQTRYPGRGEAIIVNNDLPKAKKAALHDAFKSALQKAVGVYVKSQSKVEDFELSYSRVMSHSEGYIRDYSITKEETSGGLYAVEISAEVYGSKIETAFSQRIEQYIKANLIAPLAVNLSITKSDGRYTLFANLHGFINDPTVEMESIMIKMPRSGWVRPKIFSAGTISVLSVSEDGNPGKYFKDMPDVMRSRSVSVKLKNPETGLLETRTLAVDRFNSLNIAEDMKEIVPRIQGQTLFNKLEKGMLEKVIRYCESVK